MEDGAGYRIFAIRYAVAMKPTLRLAVAGGALVLAAACGGGGGGGKTPTPPAAAQPSPTVTRTTPSSAGTALSTTPVPGSTAATSSAARIELFASPQQLRCDGGTPSSVTARVFDEAGRQVDDGTPVRFSVVTLGTANPIDTKTRNGIAETAVVAFASGQGVVVNVTSGGAAAAIRIDCL